MNEEILKILKEKMTGTDEAEIVESSESTCENKTYELGLIFGLDEDYHNKAEFCNNNGYVINEIERDSNGNRQFQICEIPEPSELEKYYQEQSELQYQLNKYKEDVEQVDLFGMERDDYEDKKSQCAELVKQLREINAKIKELQEENN